MTKPIRWPPRDPGEATETTLRRFRRMAIMLASQIPGSDDFVRASGQAHCELCGLELIDHPVCGDELLHVRCDGVLCKL